MGYFSSSVSGCACRSLRPGKNWRPNCRMVLDHRIRPFAHCLRRPGPLGSQRPILPFRLSTIFFELWAMPFLNTSSTRPSWRGNDRQRLRRTPDRRARTTRMIFASASMEAFRQMGGLVSMTFCSFSRSRGASGTRIRNGPASVSMNSSTLAMQRRSVVPSG